MAKTIRIGTGGSDLAVWQGKTIAAMLALEHPDTKIELNVFTSQGDGLVDESLPSIGGKGVLIAELQRALIAKQIDCIVHSLKDLPTSTPQGMQIVAIPKRGDVADVLISKRGRSLDTLPKGAKIGTGSIRRKAQLLHYRPDLQIIEIRGNIASRVKQVLARGSDYDGIVLAQSGIAALGLMDKVSQIIPLEIMLPAPAQGAMVVVARYRDERLFYMLDDAESSISADAERVILRGIGKACDLPVATLASYDGELFHFKLRILSPDGKKAFNFEEQRSRKSANFGNTASMLALRLTINARDAVAEILNARKK